MQSSSPFLYDTLLLVNKISKHKLSPIHSRSLEALSTRGVAMSCGNVGGGDKFLSSLASTPSFRQSTNLLQGGNIDDT